MTFTTSSPCAWRSGDNAFRARRLRMTICLRPPAIARHPVAHTGVRKLADEDSVARWMKK